jgi:hypothetical protein
MSENEEVPSATTAGNSEPDAIPSEATQTDNVAQPASTDSDPLDGLLSEYEAATKQADNAGDAGEVEGDSGLSTDADVVAFLDKMERDSDARFSAADFIDPRDQQINAMRAAEHQRMETEDFVKFGQEIMSKLPSGMPDPEGFVQDKLLALAATEPVVKLAFDLRKVPVDKARAEMAKLEYAWNMLQRTPNYPDAQAIAQQIQQRYQTAAVAANSKQIMFRVQQQIIKQAREQEKHRIDPEATEDRNAVAAAVRGASTQLPPEPPPDFARMSDRELAQWKRQNFRR